MTRRPRSAARPSGCRLKALLFFSATTGTGFVHGQQFSHHHAYAAPYQSGKYGWSIAATEDWTVVGAPFANTDSGEVRIYPTAAFLNDANATPVILTQSIIDDSTRRHGATVAVHGDKIAVGNCSAQGGSEYCDEEAPWVTLFAHDGSSWHQTQRIFRPATATGRFGSAIALNDEWMAIGGARTGTTQVHRDVVYLYRWNGDVLSELPDDSLQGEEASGLDADEFGHALAISAEHLVVGARSDDELGVDAGAAYVFASDGSASPAYGDLVRKLLASDGSAGDLFGFSAAVLGNTCVVGAPQKGFNGMTIGSAYAFDRNEGFTDNWGQVSVLAPGSTDQGADRQYGATVALSAERIAVGAPLDPVGSEHIQGAVAVFAPQGSDWMPAQTITPRYDGHVNDVGRCGTALAFAGGGLLIGAPWAIIDDATDFPTGGVLVYTDPLLGVQERPALNARIWPVPATDHLMVHADVPLNAPLRTILRDATGRTLVDRSYAHGSVPVRMDLSALLPGAYVIEVINNRTAGSFRSLFVRQ